MSTRSRFIYFEPQPDFPREDISDGNARMASYYLEAMPDRQAYANIHQRTIPILHEIANAALIGAEVNPGNTKKEYQAFCSGFTMLNYLAVLLDSRPFRQIHDGTSFNRFFLQSGEMADFELYERRQAWELNHWRTLELMREVSDKQGETAKQLAARAMGVQIASEILDT